MPKDTAPFYSLAEYISLCQSMGYNPRKVYAVHITERIIKFTYETDSGDLRTAIHEVRING